ncbi:hypothetical protein BC832DRAFT_259806 [Gaertneriomyces semiglobifer]|nr:hypothetical protein BC832DRAFT_259806 [Gaertneriomyces semiglobifer]
MRRQRLYFFLILIIGSASSLVSAQIFTFITFRESTTVSAPRPSTFPSIPTILPTQLPPPQVTSRPSPTIGVTTLPPATLTRLSAASPTTTAINSNSNSTKDDISPELQLALLMVADRMSPMALAGPILVAVVALLGFVATMTANFRAHEVSPDRITERVRSFRLSTFGKQDLDDFDRPPSFMNTLRSETVTPWERRASRRSLLIAEQSELTGTRGRGMRLSVNFDQAQRHYPGKAMGYERPGASHNRTGSSSGKPTPPSIPSSVHPVIPMRQHAPYTPQQHSQAELSLHHNQQQQQFLAPQRDPNVLNSGNSGVTIARQYTRRQQHNPLPQNTRDPIHATPFAHPAPQMPAPAGIRRPTDTNDPFLAPTVPPTAYAPPMVSRNEPQAEIEMDVLDRPFNSLTRLLDRNGSVSSAGSRSSEHSERMEEQRQHHLKMRELVRKHSQKRN